LVIDLTTVSRKFFGSLGPENTKALFLHLKPGASLNYPEGKLDDTHFQERGANEVAKLVIKELRKLDMGLKEYVIVSALDK
jgi:hypothetical protein